MPATNIIRIPRLPAAARRAGATSVRRCSANVFSVGFALDGLHLGNRGLQLLGRSQGVLVAERQTLGAEYHARCFLVVGHLRLDLPYERRKPPERDAVVLVAQSLNQVNRAQGDGFGGHGIAA